ncbi:MAG TPA: hypothetical protein VHO28_02465, partial [Ignavibacteriales bacterium]|nr:hypothetical protein [Ignavibacteriales bacterium]
LVFNVNYTHIFSKAQYPYTKTVRIGRVNVDIDTAYTDKLINQPDDIINFSLGYDYKDFSMRVSMLYQTDISNGTNQYPQLRPYIASYKRWDFSAKQKLPWYNIELYGDLFNITGVYDKSVIAAGGVPMTQEEYGLVANLGMRITL